MRLLRVFRRREHGQALVEFSLVAIVFFILVFGMIDVGRAVWNYNALAQATREGTRYAIVHGADSTNPSGPGDDADVETEVEKFAGGLNLSQLTVQTTWLNGSNTSGSSVTVTSQYTYEPIFNFLGVVSFNMTSSSTMEITN